MINWRNVAYQAAERAGHPDPEMFVRQMMAESGLRPNVVSQAGAIGIAQIMPATARGWGVDPHDPVASLNAAARAMTKYIRSYNGDFAKALAAYNAGVGAVQRYNGVPPYAETRSYIKKILSGHPATGVAPAGPQRGVQATQGPGLDPTTASNQMNRIMYAYRGNEILAQPHLDKVRSRMLTNTTGPVVGAAENGIEKVSGKVPPRLPGEAGWRYLQRIGQSMFGLRNDPGNSQTTGGRHSAGSDHYRGTAIDFGNALNTRQQLAQWDKYVEGTLVPAGIVKDHFWDLNNQYIDNGKPVKGALGGHADHSHTSTWRSSKNAQKRPSMNKPKKTKRARKRDRNAPQ